MGRKIRGSDHDRKADGTVMDSQKTICRGRTELLMMRGRMELLMMKCQPISETGPRRVHLDRGFSGSVGQSFPAATSWEINVWGDERDSMISCVQTIIWKIYRNRLVRQRPVLLFPQSQRPPFYLRPDAAAKPGMYAHARRHVLNKEQKKH